MTGARVRRLALEALTTAAAVDVEMLEPAAHDPDAQVRRMAMRAAAAAAPQVQPADAQRADAGRRGRFADRAARSAAQPARPQRCRCVRRGARGDRRSRRARRAVRARSARRAAASAPDAVAALEREGRDLSDAGDAARLASCRARAWSRSPQRRPNARRRALPQFTGSRIWQLRMYAARAAAQLENRGGARSAGARRRTTTCARRRSTGCASWPATTPTRSTSPQLARSGNQIAARRGAARSTARRIADEAVPALKAAWQRLVAEGRDNSHDARDAIAKTLASLGADPRRARRHRRPSRRRDPTISTPRISAVSRRRARASTIRGVGTFELALLHGAGAGRRAALRASRRSRLLQRPDLPSRGAELRHSGRQPRRQRVHRRRQLHARRGRPVAARARRGRHLDARPRHRRRADLHRSRRQPAPRSRVHRVRAGAQRHRRRRSRSSKAT